MQYIFYRPHWTNIHDASALECTKKNYLNVVLETIYFVDRLSFLAPMKSLGLKD